MITQTSLTMTSEEPFLKFCLEFNTRQKALDCGIRHLTNESWEQFLEFLTAVNHAQRTQVRIRSGDWYMRHAIAATGHDITAYATNAIEVVQEMRSIVADTGFPAHSFDDLADFAITFAQSIRNDPGILSTKIPRPPTAIISDEFPLI